MLLYYVITYNSNDVIHKIIDIYIYNIIYIYIYTIQCAICSTHYKYNIILYFIYCTLTNVFW